jgi:acetyl esterase/lipase
MAAGADYRIEANIRYAPHAETVLDILQARAPALKNRPAVVVIHGGGWVEGTKEDAVLRFCVPFLDRGMVVANVEYRLANVAPAPAAITDVFAAIAWLRSRAQEYKIDPNQILVTGYSAGGHLALMAAMAPESAGFGPSTKIAAVINFYGIADVADQLEGPNQRPYALAWIPEQPNRMDLARSVSPITYVRKGLPPILTIHGDADDVVPYAQSQRLTKELKAAGVDTELITIPGGKHGFEPPEMDKAWPQLFKWLKRRKINL